MIGFIKQDFVKKRGGANQNVPHKEGGWSKRGRLEQFHIFRVAFGQKEGGDFLGGDSYPGAHYVILLG